MSKQWLYLHNLCHFRAGNIEYKNKNIYKIITVVEKNKRFKQTQKLIIISSRIDKYQ